MVTKNAMHECTCSANASEGELVEAAKLHTQDETNESGKHVESSQINSEKSRKSTKFATSEADGETLGR